MNLMGREIKNKRKQLGLTQTEVAAGFMSVAKLSNIENGKVQPDSETWAYLKERLKIGEGVIGLNETVSLLKLFTSQAETYAKTNLVERAIEKYDEIIKRANENLLFEYRSLAYLKLGRIYLEQRNYKLAHSCLEKALDFFEGSGDLPRLLECKLEIGVLYFKQEHYLKSLDYLNRVIHDIPNHMANMKGHVFYYIATIYYRLNDLDNANYACEKALLTFTEEHDEYLMATLNLQAILLKRVNMYLMAKEKLEQVKLLAVKYNNNLLLGKCWHNLGDIELESHNYDKAKEYFSLSLEVKQKIHDEIGIIRTTAYMAKLFLQMGLLQEARKLGSEALKLSRKNGLRYEELVCLSTLSKIHAAFGENDQFLDISLKAMVLAGELSFDNKKIELLETMAKYFHDNGNMSKCSEMLYKAFKLKYKLD